MPRAPAVLIAAALGAACTDRGATTAPPAPAVEVSVTRPLRKATVVWDRYVGRLEAVRHVDVRARVSGHLDSIHFSEGQVVAKGDLLFVIDPRPFEAVLAGARADRSQAEARVTQAQADLSLARADRRAAESVLTLAKNRLERAERAVATEAVARETVDIRTSEVLQAEAAVEASDARIDAARAAIETANAGILTADASIESASIDLDFTRVHAPISGRIGQRLVTQGNLVQGGSLGATLLTTIVSIDPIHCYFDADEREFLRYSRLARDGTRESSRDVRNPVYVALQDESGYPHLGHMDFVDNQLDPDTGTMRGRAILANPDGFLTPGMFATVRLPASPRHEVLLIPDACIVTDQSERIVFLVDDAGVVVRRTVTLGPIIHGLRSIEAGLDGSERVVTRGVQKISAGAAVRAVEETVEIDATDDGLPDDYAPLPPDQWLSVDEPAAVEERR